MERMIQASGARAGGTNKRFHHREAQSDREHGETGSVREVAFGIYFEIYNCALLIRGKRADECVRRYLVAGLLRPSRKPSIKR
jgi:hypothetical protein